jgi:hypothetical protein
MIGSVCVWCFEFWYFVKWWQIHYNEQIVQIITTTVTITDHRCTITSLEFFHTFRFSDKHNYSVFDFCSWSYFCFWPLVTYHQAISLFANCCLKFACTVFYFSKPLCSHIPWKMALVRFMAVGKPAGKLKQDMTMRCGDKSRVQFQFLKYLSHHQQPAAIIIILEVLHKQHSTRLCSNGRTWLYWQTDRRDSRSRNGLVRDSSGLGHNMRNWNHVMQSGN